MWTRLCQALDAPELVDEPGFGSDPERVAHRARVNEAVGRIFATRSTREWTERLLRAGVPCGPIHRIDQVFADPQVQHLGMSHPAQHPTRGEVGVVAQPISMSRSNWALRNTTPEQGEHTDEILAALGYDAAAIAGLRARKAV
jgi:crotonobetainyl-CoA:carnitine CoA-transferase CaiB-like acyl-CoA transferase